jgi:hypothetical protein
MKQLQTSTTRAIAILIGASAVAFAISTVAVSSATARSSVPGAAVKYPFAKFAFTGGVSTTKPGKPSTFGLTFKTSFTLNPKSPGIGIATTGTLQNVAITERVSYPIPGGAFVGPVRLPFASETLVLAVAISGKCFVVQPNGDYGFKGKLSCVTSTLKLGSKTYKVSKLLTSVGGTFTVSPTGADQWTASLHAEFDSPGYTFPVATLGSGGFTSLIIGSNGGKLPTRSITFSG